MNHCEEIYICDTIDINILRNLDEKLFQEKFIQMTNKIRDYFI